MADSTDAPPTKGERPPTAARRPDVSALPRGTTIDRYVVIDKVGEGGMGVVYAAYDEVLHRRVALKLVTLHGDPTGQQRLVAEARAMAQGSHPAIVAVYDVGEHDGRVFLAMEFIDGQTLRHWQASPRSWRDVVSIYVRVARGLVHAHAAGIVHRDFKPDNVLVDTEGNPRITDFGLAKVAPGAASTTSPGSQHTLTGTGAGTPGYMPPEQRAGEPTDAQTDQYAFCAALFEALAGKLPTGTDGDPAIAAVPPEVVAAIRRGLADDRAARWPSIAALTEAISPPPRARRWPWI